MSLRALGQLLAALGLVLLAWLGWSLWRAQDDVAPLQPAGGAALSEQQLRMLLDQSDTTRGAVLRRGDAALEFELPSAAATVRILLNPGVADAGAARSRRQADPTLRWRYAVQTEALDGRGRVLAQREHHFRRDFSEAVLPGGVRSTGAFYLEPGASWPLRADELLLDFAGLPTPARLRVRLLAADADIADVLVRLYTPEPRTQRDAAIQWQRLSEEQQRQLAAGNLFPPQALAERERENLIGSRWTAAAPRSGASFRELHVLRDMPSAQTPEAELPPGLALGPGRVVTVQLAPSGARVRVALEPHPDGPPPAPLAATPVVLRWAGHSAFERRTLQQGWEGLGPFEARADLGGGWLEIESAREAVARVYLETDGQVQEITPQPQLLRAWSVQPGEPLEYGLLHAGGEPTPLRLVLRRLAQGGAAPSGAPVAVTMLDAQGAVIHKAEIAFQAPPSRYDRSWPEVAGLALSEPQEAFFNVPPAAATLRVESAEPLLAVAYTRPAGLPRQVRTPEDAQDPEAAATAIPAWFALQPLQQEWRLLNGRHRLLAIQGRPPDDRPELAAGRYAWEDFNPLRGGGARVFLAPRESGVPDRDESLATTFRPVPAGGAARFQAAPGHESVNARLAWNAAAPARFRYRVTLDGQPWAEGAAGGIAGEITLPAFEPGAHALRVTSDVPLRWFASHLVQGEPWVRREAQRIERPLQFEVERRTSEEEFISVRVFQPAGTVQRMRVRVHIDAPHRLDAIGPLPGWLFTQRVHDVRPSGEHALPVAETAGSKTDAGQPFYIPLPPGAPRGRYRITLVPEAGEGWLMLSRVTPGLVPQRRLVVETAKHGE